ncbi:MAG: PH domain-containing protein [Dehalococcoidia bacterium]
MGPIFLIIVVLVVVITAYVTFNAKEILYVLGAVLLFGAPWIFLKWLQWRYTIYAATNRRILCQTGIISKSYVDCPLDKVQTVYLEIPIFGRMNNFGTVRVATAGEVGVEIEWINVREPMKTQRALNEIIQKYGRGAS